VWNAPALIPCAMAGIGVFVGVAVGVSVGVFVAVAVFVKVAVGPPGVQVGVGVIDGVSVGVGVRVFVGVAVGAPGWQTAPGCSIGSWNASGSPENPHAPPCGSSHPAVFIAARTEAALAWPVYPCALKSAAAPAMWGEAMLVPLSVA
jgi:hypothetical protein